MKKTIFIFAIFFCAFSILNAQDEFKSKKGIPILPEEGDYALGIDAVPFFEYFGNALNGSNDISSAGFEFTQGYPFTIYGKYFVDAKTAYRAKFQITTGSFTDREYVTKSAPWADVDPFVTVEDKAKYGRTDIVLGLGMEKRKGKGRVQGIYGAEALIMFGSTKETYTYGNTWDPDPTMANYFYDFGNNIDYNPTTGDVVALYDEVKYGSTFGIGVRGFVGVEYFFAPKISIGGEFGWGIDFMSRGDGETAFQYEDVNTSTGAPYINTGTMNNGGNSSFFIGTDNLYGALNLFFYFQ